MGINPALEGFEPKVALGYVSDILQIPRQSEKEDGMVRYLERWAKQNAFTWTVDKFKNVVIKVPARPGYVNAPIVGVQAHIDMVYTPNDPALIAQPIEIEVVDGWLQTKNRYRTLGMDNAAGLVLAMDAAITAQIRGGLEIVCTADEEGGMTGAEGLSPAFHNMKARTLINIDTPEGGKIAVESAGMQYVESTIRFGRRNMAGPGYRIVLANFAGGHSGDHVGLNRGNAIKLMAEMLVLLPPRSTIVEFRSTGAGNAIPSQATAIVMVKENAWQSQFEYAVEAARISLKRPEITLTIEPCVIDGPSLTDGSARQLLELFAQLPDGVQEMSTVVPGLPALSTTLSVVDQKDDVLTFKQIVRGCDEQAMQSLARRIIGIYEKAGALSTLGHHGPAWKQDPNTPLVRAAAAAYRQCGVEPVLKGYHCALELAALLGDPNKPNFDRVLSFGCEVQDEHAVSERMSMNSMVNARSVLHVVLEEIATGAIKA